MVQQHESTFCLRARLFCSILARSGGVLVVIALVGAALSANVALAQNSVESDQRVGESEVTLRSLLRGVAAGSPGDELYLAVLRDAEVAVPILDSWIKGDSGVELSDAELDVAADAICYVPSTAAIETIANLSSVGAQRFRHLLPRCLNYAIGRANPYTLAYAAVDSGGVGVRADVARWLRGMTPGKKEFADWAAAIKSRSVGGRVGKEDLSEDPLVRLLDRESPPRELVVAVLQTE